MGEAIAPSPPWLRYCLHITIFSCKVIKAFQVFFVLLVKVGIHFCHLHSYDEFVAITRYQYHLPSHLSNDNRINYSIILETLLVVLLALNNVV